MPPVKYSSILALEDNSTEMYMACTEVLLRIARNILKEPENPKYRSISLDSNVVTNKLLPASGAIQCLFEMGFQEGSDKLVLPQGSSLVSVQTIYDELLKGRELRKNKNPKNVITNRPAENPVFALIKREITRFMAPVNNQFLKQFVTHILQICESENTSAQLKALNCIPLVDLKENVMKTIKKIQLGYKKKQITEEAIDCQLLLLLELCKWFRGTFFQWVNTPECTRCGCKDTVFSRHESRKEERIEVYKCNGCGENVLFPRYSSAEKLLETRRGRCGEFANCFYLMCRSLGWDTRYVVDVTDHVWIEVYSLTERKWIHCDPCETVIDAPLMYESGWKKNLSYVIAFSRDDIQDVTWRYSSNHSKVMSNRKNCTEEQLIDMICNIRRILTNFVSAKRKEFIMKRASLELVDLMVQKSATESEMRGRSSGSLAWRLARGEITMTNEEFKPHVWKPETIDEDVGKFVLSYCTSADEYALGAANSKMIPGWRNGLNRMRSIFRKEESDWKMVYLARTEGTEVGTLSWRFEVNDGFVIGDVHVKLVSQIFENGSVLSKLCNDNTCIRIPNSGNMFTTSDFKGSKQVELIVELSGGRGDNAWQHAQLLRQSCGEKEKTFQMIIVLIRL